MALTNGALLASFHSVSDGSDSCHSHSQAQLSGQAICCFSTCVDAMV